MPYIRRNTLGDIVSLTQEADDIHKEYVSPTNKELVQFLSAVSNEEETALAKTTLSESDLEFARASEDLINLLIEKNIILFTELPPAVQAKIVAREKLRSNLGNHTYSFLDDGESL